MRMPWFSRSLVAAGIVALGMTLSAAPCKADVFVGSGTNAETGDSVSASALFEISGDTLTITLKNTTLGGTLLRGDILTGLVWDISGATPVLAFPTTALTAGSDIFTNKTTSNTSDPVNGSWTNVLGATPISQYGVATTGFNDSAFPLIQDTLTFTLTGISGVSQSQITNVKFLFGTDGTGIITTMAVPEPGTFALAGIGLGAAGLVGLRRGRRNPA